MFTESVSFYGLAGLLLGALSFVIFASRMFLASIALIFSVLFTALLCWVLKAKFIALSMFFVFGILICPAICVLMNSISRWNLPLKLVHPAKIVFSVFSLFLFFALTIVFVREEFSRSLINIFNFVNMKSSEGFNFSEYIFPLHLVIILTVTTLIVVRALVFPIDSENSQESQNDSLSRELNGGVDRSNFDA